MDIFSTVSHARARAMNADSIKGTIPGQRREEGEKWIRETQEYIIFPEEEEEEEKIQKVFLLVPLA